MSDTRIDGVIKRSVTSDLDLPTPIVPNRLSRSRDGGGAVVVVVVGVVVVGIYDNTQISAGRFSMQVRHLRPWIPTLEGINLFLRNVYINLIPRKLLLW